MKFTDKNGIELDISDRVILARPNGTGGAALDVVTIVRMNDKTKKISVKLDEKPESGNQTFVTNYAPEKFWKLAGI